MKFNGAIVKVGDNDIALAVVGKDFMTLPLDERMGQMRGYASAFPGLPFVVLIDNEDGTNEYFGRPDLIAQLRDVPLNYITFKVFTTKED